MQPFLCDLGKKLAKWLQALWNKNQVFSFKSSLIFYGYRLFGIRRKNPEKMRKPGAVFYYQNEKVYQEYQEVKDKEYYSRRTAETV